MVARRCEYTAAALWAFTAALGMTGFFFTVSFAGVGAVIAVPLLAWLSRKGDFGRAQLGGIVGLAAFPLWIAWLHRDYQPCPAPAADVADGNWQCGGTDPRPFLAAAAIILLAFVALWVLHRAEPLVTARKRRGRR